MKATTLTEEITPIPTSYTFFYAAILHSRLEEVNDLVYKYIDPSAACIIGMEIAPGKHELTNGEHMHFAVHMSEEQWKLFYKTFVNKFNLGGKNSKNKSYYGRIKPDKIKDETRFLSYTLKDKNYKATNVSLEDLANYIKNSFEKVTKKSLDERLQEHINAIIWQLPSGDDPESFIAKEIIQYYRDNPKLGLPNKHLIKRQVLKHLLSNNKYSNTQIYNFIYNN